MKIEKNIDGSGFTLINSAGELLRVSFMEFWSICNHGTTMDTKDEVENYLSQCPDINGHDLDRIRAFPALVDKITEQVIQDRIKEETGDQIYYAAETCIKTHIAEIEDKVKWFKLSDVKCVSVWYAPDEYAGDQFQLHLEEIGEDGRMGPGCEILSSDSYATTDISFEALHETLKEICDDAEIEDRFPWAATATTAFIVAEEIFDAFGMETGTKLNEAKKESVPFCSLLPEPIGSELDLYFKKNNWELQAWGTGEAKGYQVFFGAGVQVDNNYEYGFPYLLDKEELLSFAKDFYDKRILQNDEIANFANVYKNAFDQEPRENVSNAKPSLESVINNAQKHSDDINTSSLLNIKPSKLDLKDKLTFEMQKQYFKDEGGR